MQTTTHSPKVTTSGPMTDPNAAGAPTDATGQQVIEGKPHQPLEGEKQRPAEKATIDSNPGEPAVPFRPQPGEADNVQRESGVSGTGAPVGG